jgi:hypothetical protein
VALTRVQAPAKRITATVKRGTGADTYTVKGKRATARQRDTIDGVLEQAHSDNASRRVMIATVMAITQESVAGDQQTTTGNDDSGIFQQGRNWVSAAGAKDPAASTHAFLVTGPTSWKKVHGGVKKAPGNLSEAVHEVQRNQDPNAYAPWEAEATKTVDTWLANGATTDGGSYVQRYTFTRGERGGHRENSWDAAQRLVEEVGAFRWAAGNVFYAVSDEELIAGAPSLTVYGDEGWLLKAPAWSWAAGRAISEMTLEVLADHWDTMPGAVIVLHRRFGAMAGRWKVWNVGGDSLESPQVTVTLRRPTRLKSEPAPEVASRDTGTGTGGALEDICKRISDDRSTYLYGGGHGVKLANLKASDHMDCSSSCSLALFRARMFDGSVAISSTEFAASWGKPGKGRSFTVWANAEHVWIEGYDSDGSFAWRFDTSQHDSPSGPAYTKKLRTDQGRFTARHWPGL